jgi:hypothetical protein
MARGALGVPVFGADNHFYEPHESLTKFLPSRDKAGDRLRRSTGPDQDRRAGLDEGLVP